MPVFIRLKKKDRIDLFSQIKNKLNCTWMEFYSKFKISRPMFFHYLAGRYDIPEELLKKWQEIAGIKIENPKRIERPRYLEKRINKIELDSQLAEILGVLNGDGHISKLNYEVCVVGNSLEKDYYLYLKNLFENKFGIPFTLTVYKSKYAFKLRTYSMHLSNLLTKEYGLPKGYKIGQLRIPEQILSAEPLLKSYLRGLFDTDGCFHVRREKDPMISITSADPRFLKEIRFAFNSLGFRVAKGRERMFIYNKTDVVRFFNEIKPANSKHLKKYQGWYLNNARLV